jgi:mgtE-like transporter
MAIPRRARRLWAYWRAEQRTLRQGLVALVLSTLAGFVAGLTLSSITHTLSVLPGLFVLIPAAVGMRGTIFGAIGARLGTSTHAGLFEATLRRDGILSQNIEVAILTTLSSSLYLAALARLMMAALPGQAASISFWDLVTISVVGGLLGSVLILAITVGLSLLSYYRGYDLDAVSTPMVTALGDMVTLPTLFLATLVVRNDALNAVVAALCLALGLGAAIRGFSTSRRAVRRIVLEMTPVIAAFVSQAGALGGILSSRLTSKLQLGVITPRGRPEPPALVDASLIVVFGLAVFTFIAAVALVLSDLTDKAHPSPAVMLGGTLLAGVAVLPITIAVAYYVAVLTARFGLDPDNTGVPIITSVMDLAGVACVMLVMTLLGLAVHG